VQPYLSLYKNYVVFSEVNFNNMTPRDGVAWLVEGGRQNGAPGGGPERIGFDQALRCVSEISILQVGRIGDHRLSLLAKF
jgi:hypothetical protein